MDEKGSEDKKDKGILLLPSGLKAKTVWDPEPDDYTEEDFKADMALRAKILEEQATHPQGEE